MSVSNKLKKENPHYTLIQKLDPNVVAMSGVMAVVVGYILGTTFIEPTIAEMAVTPEGLVLARAEGDAGVPHYLGRYASLVGSWSRLLGRARLSRSEYMEAQALFAARIGFLGPAMA